MKITKHLLVAPVLIASLLLMSACSHTDSNAGSGAIVGALVGGVLGGAIGNNIEGGHDSGGYYGHGYGYGKRGHRGYYGGYAHVDNGGAKGAVRSDFGESGTEYRPASNGC